MSDNRKYYYLKLKENFYNSETMVILGEYAGWPAVLQSAAENVTSCHSKAAVSSCSTTICPTRPRPSPTFTRHQVGTVERALKVFVEFGLVEILTDGAYYMADINC